MESWVTILIVIIVLVLLYWWYESRRSEGFVMAYDSWPGYVNYDGYGGIGYANVSYGLDPTPFVIPDGFGYGGPVVGMMPMAGDGFVI